MSVLINYYENRDCPQTYNPLRCGAFCIRSANRGRRNMTENEKLDYGKMMLFGINRKMNNIYSGTVDPVTIQERRAKNKRARKSRRINRSK